MARRDPDEWRNSQRSTGPLVPLAVAREKIHYGQISFLDQLEHLVAKNRE
jgi:hypothetical protein